MLILRRKVGERIVLHGGIEIVVTSIEGKTVRLGVVAPPGVDVLRGEVHDAIVEATRAAAQPPPAEDENE